MSGIHSQRLPRTRLKLRAKKLCQASLERASEVFSRIGPFCSRVNWQDPQGEEQCLSISSLPTSCPFTVKSLQHAIEQVTAPASADQTSDKHAATAVCVAVAVGVHGAAKLAACASEWLCQRRSCGTSESTNMLAQSMYLSRCSTTHD